MTQALVAGHNNFFHQFFQTNHNIVEDMRVRTYALNRSQRPRLINMLLVSSEKHSSKNFLTILLEKNSPLIRERIGRKKAMLHWFLRGQDDYDSRELSEKAALRSAIIDGLARSRVDEVLDEAEGLFKLLGFTAVRS